MLLVGRYVDNGRLTNHSEEPLMKSYPFIRIGLIVLALLGLLLTVTPHSAHAAGLIVVTSAADSVGSDGLCTLREAITNANKGIL